MPTTLSPGHSTFSYSCKTTRHWQRKFSEVERVLNHKHMFQDGFDKMFLVLISSNWFKKFLLNQISTSLSPGYSTFSYFCKIMRLFLLKKCFLFNILVHLVWTNMTRIAIQVLYQHFKGVGWVCGHACFAFLGGIHI